MQRKAARFCEASLNGPPVSSPRGRSAPPASPRSAGKSASVAAAGRRSSPPRPPAPLGPQVDDTDRFLAVEAGHRPFVRRVVGRRRRGADEIPSDTSTGSGSFRASSRIVSSPLLPPTFQPCPVSPGLCTTARGPVAGGATTAPANARAFVPRIQRGGDTLAVDPQQVGVRRLAQSCLDLDLLLVAHRQPPTPARAAPCPRPHQYGQLPGQRPGDRAQLWHDCRRRADQVGGQ